MTGKSWGQVQAERRENALAKLARGEKVSFSEQALVKDELAVQRRDVAVAKLAAGEKLSHSERGAVQDELAQKQQAETERRAESNALVAQTVSAADAPLPPPSPWVAFGHRIGVVTIEGGEVINRMVVGKGRKQRSIEQRWLVVGLVAMRRSRGAYGLKVTLYSADQQMGDSIDHCNSKLEVEAFAAELVAVNSAIETNVSLSNAVLSRDAEAARHEKPVVDVVIYKDARHYQRDATQRIANGWVIAGQSQDASRAKVAGKLGTAAVSGALFMSPLIGAVSMLAPQRKAGAITVTWTKQPTPLLESAVMTTSPTTPSPHNYDGLAAELQKVVAMHESGALSDEEFQAAKARLLGS